MLQDAPRAHYQELLDQYQVLFMRILGSANTATAETTDLVLLRQAVLGMINLIIEWYRPEGRLSEDAIKAQLTRLIVDGLLRPA